MNNLNNFKNAEGYLEISKFESIKQILEVAVAIPSMDMKEILLYGHLMTVSQKYIDTIDAKHLYSKMELVASKSKMKDAWDRQFAIAEENPIAKYRMILDYKDKQSKFMRKDFKKSEALVEPKKPTPSSTPKPPKVVEPVVKKMTASEYLKLLKFKKI